MPRASVIASKNPRRGIQLVLRGALGAFLLAAAAGKALDVRGYVDIVKTYQLGLPDAVVWPAAVGVIAAEACLGLWILSGLRVRTAALASVALHACYFCLLGLTLLRGVEVPNCGCFGVFLARPLEPSTLLEDLVLVALSWVLFRTA
jgi:hypothetical protein